MSLLKDMGRIGLKEPKITRILSKGGSNVGCNRPCKPDRSIKLRVNINTYSTGRGKRS